MFYDRDNDVFLRDFGTEVVYIPKGTTASAPITVIWDEPGNPLSFGKEQIIATDTQAKAKSTDVSAIQPQDRIVKDSVTYYVMDPRPDGTGFTQFKLTTRVRA